MSQPILLKNESHYIRLTVKPPTPDALTIRKTISDALKESFGLVEASTYLDVLWVEERGKDCVIRLHESDVNKIAAALAAWTQKPSMSVQKDSPFLPSLLSEITEL